VVEAGDHESSPDLGPRLAASGTFDDWQVVVIHDDVDVAKSSDKFLWATWTRFNPATDIYARETVVKNNHIGYAAPMVIDARMKSHYPAVVEPRGDIVKMVDRRWNEYFPPA
jgi:3-polyprenyl-4-hydroxybenzoate decarboxylase